jgi:Flp pilus assembly protein TadG
VRVQLSREKDERGAVALMVAMLSVVLMVVGAFVIDLGMAYVSKRELQNASDSAALAAARLYAEESGTCLELAGDAALREQAQSAADDYRARNHPGSVAEEFEVACNGDGELEVTYAASAETQTGFAQLAGAGETITTGRRSAALVDVALSGTRMRPLAVCSSQLPDNWQHAGVIRIDFPGPSWTPPPGCPMPTGPPGNWWTLDCPEERDSSTGQPGDGLEDLMLNGCSEPMEEISEQPSDPSELTDHLIDSCASAPLHSTTCFSGDPGELDAGHLENVFRSLMTEETSIFVPVLCGPPDCSDATLQDQGTNAIIPVYKVAALRVCGFHLKRTPATNRGVNTSGICNPLPVNPLTDHTNDNYLLVTFTTVMTSGGTSRNNCELGSDCDSGLRRVHLSR